MEESLTAVLCCPECHSQLKFTGTRTGRRLANGVFECLEGHLFQVKSEIPILKENKLTRHEFAWRVKIPNVQRYDRIRSRYRSYLSEGLVKADERLVDALVRLTSRARIGLDVASGMGTLVLAMSKQGKVAHVLGTDVDEIPLRAAMLKSKQQGLYARVSLCVMDGKHLALKSGSVPVVASHFGFNNIPDAKQAFAEAFRVLTPNGNIVFSALLLQQGSKSHKKATGLGFGNTMSEAAITATLEEAGFSVDGVEKFYEGKWLRNPMDLLPLEGDWFAHSLVQAHKEKHMLRFHRDSFAAGY